MPVIPNKWQSDKDNQKSIGLLRGSENKDSKRAKESFPFNFVHRQNGEGIGRVLAGLRICLARLMGNRQVDVIRHALCENRHVKLSILTDCLRGTREAPEPSCASLLASLVDEFGVERVEVRMYHTPNLTGLRKKHIPKRINEGWGLQHMKLYGVDDEIILSGANLSHDYFTDRQDRYHLFSCPDVTNYFCKLHKAVCSLSFRVLPSAQSQRFSLEWPESNRAPCPLSRPRAFVSKASSVVREHIRPGSAPEHQQDEGKDTCVFVISQMSQLMRPDDSTELLVVTHILKSLGRDEYRNSRWTFTAGYFNPAPILTKLLLQTKSTVSTVITASPYANGFYKSPGVSGLLPDAYTYLARKFLQAILNQNREEDITLKEWRKGTVGEPGAWTYHAKGLWVTLPGENSPCMSIIGSSNYSKRSHSLDLETGALIVTRDEDLKRRLGEEEAWLQEHATKVTRDDLATKERRVGLKVRIAMWIVRLVGSAL